jgi:hypothetical protein
MFVSDRADDALEMISAGLDLLLSEGLDPICAETAADAIREVESAGRRIVAAQTMILGSVRRRCLHTRDGHASAKVMVRHVAELSGGEAAAREKTAVMLAALEQVEAAFVAGDLGVDQTRLSARVYANKRVRFAMAGAQDWFLEIAAEHAYPDFETLVRQWEGLLDADGPEPATVRNRQVSLRQDPVSLGWNLDGNLSSVAGAQISEILDHYLQAERSIDWDKAVAEHGDDTCEDHMARTAAQQRADALHQVFLDAAANPDGSYVTDFTTNIVMDQRTFEKMLARLEGGPHQPLDPTKVRCETLGGVQLDPAEAASVSLIGDFRRVIIDGEGVTIDLGRRRLFTGGARLAAQLQRTRCYWPGCWTRTPVCEIDHLRPHAGGGLTNPRNGEPACGCHNQTKQRGFTVTRNPSGGLTLTRPDGSILALAA